MATSMSVESKAFWRWNSTGITDGRWSEVVERTFPHCHRVRVLAAFSSGPVTRFAYAEAGCMQCSMAAAAHHIRRPAGDSHHRWRLVAAF